MAKLIIDADTDREPAVRIKLAAENDADILVAAASSMNCLFEQTHVDKDMLTQAVISGIVKGRAEADSDFSEGNMRNITSFILQIFAESIRAWQPESECNGGII
jgi:hypothetical protein